MASLRPVHYTPHRPAIADGKVAWEIVQGGHHINLPQIFWADGRPWREANLWFHDRATTRNVSLRTVQTEATAILAYAKWLEDTLTAWWDFPARKSDRCLIRFRGWLIDLRNAGKLAPSTATQRMRTVIAFYRWLRASNLLSTQVEMWRDRRLGIRLQDGFGLERTIFVNTSDLAIPNRALAKNSLEDGLIPLTRAQRDAVLELARTNFSTELFLLLSVAFFTGMRLQTIADLRIGSLENALPDPASSKLMRIRVGPGAEPAVATKFGVSGSVWMTRNLRDSLLAYAESPRRLKRTKLAAPEDRSIIFLTRYGRPYAARGVDKAPAVNVELHALRRLAAEKGMEELAAFKFHQARCTFATELARISVEAGGAIHALAIVKEALLHRSEATTLRYIRFVEQLPLKMRAANTFTQAFLGLTSPDEDFCAP